MPGWPTPAPACPNGPAGLSGAERALQASSQLVDLFWDDTSGGFFTTGSDAESLVVRPKEFLDGAVPATNSIAVAALLRASALGGEPRLDECVERTIALARPLIDQHPTALADLVAALPMWSRRNEIVVTGDRPDLLAEVRTTVAPGRRRCVGRARRRPPLRRAPDRTGFGLRLPGSLVSDSGGGHRDTGRPIGDAGRMSANVVDPGTGGGNGSGHTKTMRMPSDPGARTRTRTGT